MSEVERYRQRAARHLVAGLYRCFFPTPKFDDGSDWGADAHFRQGVQCLELAKIEETLAAKIHACAHPRAVKRCYVGSVETYFFCPDCLHTFGGEESGLKMALISAAAREDPGELGEPDKEDDYGTDSRT